LPPPAVAKGKGRGKGKRPITFNLFPEFVGEITIDNGKGGDVPRVEEMPEEEECVGGVCPIPQVAEQN